MKTFFIIFLSAVLFSACAMASEHKYGLFAHSDADLTNQLKGSETAAAVLGEIYKCEKIHDVWYFHVKVIESYKGGFKPGDKIFIFLEAEEGPDPDKEIGIRRYYLLHKCEHLPPYGEVVDKDIAGQFWCDPTEAVKYETYGKELHRAFIKARMP